MTMGRKAPNVEGILDRMRGICLSLPEAVEVASWGHPNFRAGRKTFAVLEEYKGQLCICFKATLPDQEALLNDPRFFASPYIGHQGWVSMKAEGRLNWKEIEEHLRTAYRLVALKRMVAALDARKTRGR